MAEGSLDAYISLATLQFDNNFVTCNAHPTSKAFRSVNDGDGFLRVALTNNFRETGGKREHLDWC